MAGLYFGSSRWDDIPQILGLSVEEGVLAGPWRGLPVRAQFHNFHNEQRDTYEQSTTVVLQFDPPLAQGWGLQLDVRRGQMKGVVNGRTTSARIVNQKGTLTTGVEVDVHLPPGAELSLARQEADGFFDRLFRGQDIIVGDPAFDAAFIIKGKPETFVHAALNPMARQQLLGLSHAGCSITLSNGQLGTWPNRVVTRREDVDSLMKAAYAAATALCP